MDQKTVILDNTPSSFSAYYGRAGGAYIPPAKLRQLTAAITDRTTLDYQRMTWEALKKSLNGLINKVSVLNIKNILPELFGENLLRGRGLLCRSIMKAQAASIAFTPVYAALIAVINTKFPLIGELLLNRLLAQFRRAFKRSDKAVCLASSKFIAHLVNQRVANEIIALQILTLLLERPTDDSVEVAVGFMRETGAFLTEESSKATHAVFERFRGILHEGVIDKRTQYMVEVLFQVRKEKFKDNVAMSEDLDIVEEEDQITHLIGLTDELSTMDTLNVFKFDEAFLDNEAAYLNMKREILGSESDEEEEEGSGESEDEAEVVQEAKRTMQIQDQTNTNIVNLRRGIYLTIMSSLNFEECAHKLMKLNIPLGQEFELCNMIIECCSQERTYVNFYGLLGERFCLLDQNWANGFAQAFEETYKTIHRFESNRLRNVAKYFSHLLSSLALSWNVFALVKLTESDTTSSSRIFLKILFTELVAALGMKKLTEQLNDPTMIIEVETASGIVTRGAFDGLFPKDNPKNTRFAINYFTSIGLGALTDDLREFLKNAPKVILAQQQAAEPASETDESSEESSDESSDDESGRDSPVSRKKAPRQDSPISRARREPSPASRREKSPASRREQSPPSRRGQSPPSRRGQSPASRRGQSPPSRREQSPISRSRQDSPPDFRHPSRRQRSSEVRRQRSPEVRRQRSPEVRRQRSPEVQRQRSPEVQRQRSPEVQREDTRRRNYSPENRQRGRRDYSPDNRPRRSPVRSRNPSPRPNENSRPRSPRRDSDKRDRSNRDDRSPLQRRRDRSESPKRESPKRSRVASRSRSPRSEKA